MSEIKSVYIGEKPISVTKAGGGDWPDSLENGNYPVLTELYDDFLAEENSRVQLVFKKLGIFSFGGFGASADTEGGAPMFSDDGGDPNFKPEEIQDDQLEKYLVIPINPADIQVNYSIDVTNYKTIFFSEIASITGIKLRRFTISSFFPYRVGSDIKSFRTGRIYEPKNYIDWITECMDNRVILAFKAFGDLARPLPIMSCFIESFTTKLMSNGEVQYSLGICEYIDYRQNVDSRMFVMDGDRIIVSEKENSRKDERIGIGTLVRVTKPPIYSSFVKNHPITNEDVTKKIFNKSPTQIAKSLLKRKSVTPQWGNISEFVEDEGTGLLMNKDLIRYIIEFFVSNLQTVDPSEIWMVIGGDYFTNTAKVTDMIIGSSLLDHVFQLGTYIDAFDKFSLVDAYSIKIKSMKDGRIGWVSMAQLVKVDLGVPL
jgi:hypothetical protein